MTFLSNGIIKISSPNNPKIDTHNDKSVISLKFWCDGGRRVTLGRRVNSLRIDTRNDISLKNFVVTTTIDPLPTGGSADLKSNGVIGISGPNKPKINAHNDISVISFKFWCDGGRRVTPGRRAGRRIKNLIVLLKLVPETYE